MNPTTPIGEKIKLSKVQKDIIIKMRDGYKLKWENDPVLIKKDHYSFKIRAKTAHLLWEKRLIEQPDALYILTILGRTISI